MLKTFLIVTLVIVALLGVGAAWAKHKGYCHGDAAHFIGKRLTHKLDLDEQQQDRLHALTSQFSELREQRQTLKVEIGAQVSQLLSETTMDRERAIELLDQGLQPMVDRKEVMLDALADFTDSLSPEQRSQLAELVDRRLNHRWGPRWKH